MHRFPRALLARDQSLRPFALHFLDEKAVILMRSPGGTEALMVERCSRHALATCGA